MWSIMPHMVQFQSISVQKRGLIISNTQKLTGGGGSHTGRYPEPAGDLRGTQTPRQELRLPSPNVKFWIRACVRGS